jgi:hypothetical protein
MRYLIPLLVIFRVLTNDGMVLYTEKDASQRECHPKSEWFRNEEVRDNLILRGIDFPLFFVYNYL